MDDVHVHFICLKSWATRLSELLFFLFFWDYVILKWTIEKRGKKCISFIFTIKIMLLKCVNFYSQIYCWNLTDLIRTQSLISQLAETDLKLNNQFLKDIGLDLVALFYFFLSLSLLIFILNLFFYVEFSPLFFFTPLGVVLIINRFIVKNH